LHEENGYRSLTPQDIRLFANPR